MDILDDSDDLVGPRTFSALEQLARGLRVQSGGLQDTLDAIVHAAVRTVAGTDDAGLILVDRGVLSPIATTGPRPSRLDELQRELMSGPCFDAAASQETVIAADLQRDPRWSGLHETAAELCVVSMVCVPLYLERRTTGALSMYSSSRALFDEADLAWTELFATHAALALADAQRSDQMRNALASRDTLGQAKGILMERLRISADDAFSRLSSASQITNHKVVVVASHLVATGELLEPGIAPRD